MWQLLNYDCLPLADNCAGLISINHVIYIDNDLMFHHGIDLLSFELYLMYTFPGEKTMEVL